MEHAQLDCGIDVKDVLDTERHMTDSPYQNIALLVARQEFNENILTDIFMIRLAEKLYFAKKSLEMDAEERADFCRVDNEDRLPNYEEIHVKQKYKNYASLCRFLNEPDKLTGKQRTKQIERFKRCFNWKKTGSGQEIVITQKYSKPKPEKLRGSGNAIYIKHIEYLLLAYLYHCKENTAQMSLTDMIIQFGMVKGAYPQLKQRLYEMEDFNFIDCAVKDFVQDTQNISYQLIDRTLKSLCDRRLITCEKIILVDNKEATLKQKDIIRHTELVLLKKFGLKKISQVHMQPDIQRKFYAERNKLLQEEHGWKYIQTKYQLKSKQEDILYGIQGITQEIKRELAELFRMRMYHEYDKKKQKYYNEIVDFSRLFDESENSDNETNIACHDIVADVKSADKQKYLDKYEEMIRKYIG